MSHSNAHSKETKSEEVDRLLAENAELLAEINMEGKMRKNKNLINTRLALLIQKFERNLIRIGKIVPPECLGDPDHIKKEKARFISMYHRKSKQKE